MTLATIRTATHSKWNARHHRCFASWRVVLLVGYLFHPSNVLSVANVGKGNVAHRGGRSCPVPMLHIWRTPDDVPGFYLVLFAAFLIHPSGARSDDERLPGRMRMPSGARAWQKRHKCSCLRKILVRAEIGFDHHGSGEVGLRPQRGLARAIRRNFHLVGQHRRSECREEFAGRTCRLL